MTTFADLPEDRATGRIAEIYDEIRIFGAVPYVSSLQRQLATIPGCLEWLWDAVRPVFTNGRLPEAAWAATRGLELPALPVIPREALRAFGVDRSDESSLHAIYETFLRASPVHGEWRAESGVRREQSGARKQRRREKARVACAQRV